MENIKNISCPNCNHTFDVEQVLSGKLEREYKEKLKQQSMELQLNYKKKEKTLEAQKADFEEKRKNANEMVMDRVKKEVAAKQEELEKQMAVNEQENKMKLAEKEVALKFKVKEEYDHKLKSQAEELEEKRIQLLKSRESEIELVKVKRQMEEQEKEIELRMQKRMSKEIQNKEEVLKRRLQEELETKQKDKDHQTDLEKRELLKQLEDQKKLVDEMKRKAEQGSMQMQGEILELKIEEILGKEFPYDSIEEVPKGIRGADSIQKVYNKMQQHCGTIIIESKRTKAFTSDWIPKLKSDQRSISAEIAVLVTETMPKGVESFTEINGIWVCSINELVGLIYVLRQTLIKTMAVKSSQVNKGDKMEMLYSFLTGEEFKDQISAIVEGFSAMRQDLDKEKRAMTAIWKRREKQIEVVTDNTINMHASIKGIAGKSIPAIQQLELGDGLEILGE